MDLPLAARFELTPAPGVGAGGGAAASSKSYQSLSCAFRPATSEASASSSPPLDAARRGGERRRAVCRGCIGCACQRQLSNRAAVGLSSSILCQPPERPHSGEKYIRWRQLSPLPRNTVRVRGPLLPPPRKPAAPLPPTWPAPAARGSSTRWWRAGRACSPSSPRPRVTSPPSRAASSRSSRARTRRCRMHPQHVGSAVLVVPQLALL